MVGLSSRENSLSTKVVPRSSQQKEELRFTFMLQNSNTCHENVRFVNCLICCTLQLALQNRQYLSTEEFFSPDLVDMNHTPKSPRAKQNKNSQYEEDGRIGANIIISLFFSSFQNVIRNIIYGAARTNITISSDDNTYKIVLIQILMAEEKKLPRGYDIQSTSIVVAQKLTPERGRQN